MPFHDTADYELGDPPVATLERINPVYMARAIAGLTRTDVDFAACTCCTEATLDAPFEPREAVRFGYTGEWAHLNEGTFAEMRHVHVDTRSADCDGSYSRSGVMRITSIVEEALRPEYLRGRHYTGPEFSDLWDYCLRHLPPLYGHGDSMTVTLGDGTVEWGRRTDEGGEGGYAYVCSDPGCAHDRKTFRDHRAESMGY